eukprot:363790-Chlamydomonas_euryale.AAC.25
MASTGEVASAPVAIQLQPLQPGAGPATGQRNGDVAAAAAPAAAVGMGRAGGWTQGVDPLSAFGGSGGPATGTTTVSGALDAPAPGGAAPLLQAAMHGHADQAKALLAAGADANQVDVHGRTALHHAAASRRLEGGDGGRGTAVLEVLLAAGADASAADCLGATPLHAAAQFGDTMAVYVLVGQRRSCATLQARMHAVSWPCMHSLLQPRGHAALRACKQSLGNARVHACSLLP